jgi:molybdopterin-containing oxidoreductase family membrane subunit
MAIVTGAPRKVVETNRVIAAGQTAGMLDDVVNTPVLVGPQRTPTWWWIGFGITLSLLGLYLVSVIRLITTGVGIFGNNQPVSWAMPIINFVWWIGIGHAGTLISAALLLFRQPWRTSINRFAEAMTIFAVVCAGLYPILHIGRPWVFYWLMPYPNTHGMIPNFRSALTWDVFAISTYATVSLLFWFIGLIPDLATLRDSAKSRFQKLLYGALALGWNGSAKAWQRYMRAYLLLAALSFPLVLSVHSTIAMDFAISQVPGWNNTVMPPYFVAGAVFAGFAMVLLLAIPLRRAFGFEHLITMRHLDNAAKLMLATGLIVVYGYVVEIFYAWYSGVEFEKFMAYNRVLGADHGWAFWALIACNLVAIQPLWFRRVRQTPWALFLISIFVSIGMWLERFVIVVVSLTKDFLPSSWGNYVPTFWDWALYAGSFGLFGTLFMLFLRLLPAIATTEMKELAHHDAHHGADAYESIREAYYRGEVRA